MKPTKKKLALGRETLRSLNRDQLARAAGGYSGLHDCHSLDGHCTSPSGGALCNPSDDTQCVSGLIC